MRETTYSAIPRAARLLARGYMHGLYSRVVGDGRLEVLRQPLEVVAELLELGVGHPDDDAALLPRRRWAPRAAAAPRERRALSRDYASSSSSYSPLSLSLSLLLALSVGAAAQQRASEREAESSSPVDALGCDDIDSGYCGAAAAADNVASATTVRCRLHCAGVLLLCWWDALAVCKEGAIRG